MHSELEEICSYVRRPQTDRDQGNQLMEAEKLEHFRKILKAQLAKHLENIETDQAAALDPIDDGVKDSVDMSVSDVSRELALRLGERESQMVADIDQALLRMDEGTYGTCARCGKDIPEGRLEALPTARFDAECQTLIEQMGDEEMPTL
ncbi:MAG: TraR/DksA family transcriptional regulator [Pyrinomonadaceae bacterium]